MYVMRSTHSSRLKRFPSRSMRSSYCTSMLVKDEADIVSLFIQYGGGSVGRADILVLAAKPKDMAALVGAVGPRVKKDALVITLAAGVRTSFVEKGLARRGRVVRIMPNLACAVGEGATAFALGKTATEHDALTVEEIFGAIGRVTMVEEKMLDAVTGLSGSGPGFIAALAHSMIEGGVRSGLPRDVD